EEKLNSSDVQSNTITKLGNDGFNRQSNEIFTPGPNRSCLKIGRDFVSGLCQALRLQIIPGFLSRSSLSSDRDGEGKRNGGQHDERPQHQQKSKACRRPFCSYCIHTP